MFGINVYPNGIEKQILRCCLPKLSTVKRRCARWPISPFCRERKGEGQRALLGGRSRQKARGPDAVWLVLYRYRFTNWTIRPNFFCLLLTHPLPRAGNGTDSGREKQGRQERQRE